MNAKEKEEQRELKKTVISLEAKVERREKKIEDQVRLINRMQGTINDMVEDKRKDQNKIEVLMRNNIDSEMLS